MNEAYDLIKNDIPTTERKIIKHWLYKSAHAEVNILKLLPYFESGKNNWNSYRLKVVGTIAITDVPLQQWTIAKLKNI